MGSMSEFICPNCNFRLEMCGGYSVGMTSSCQTYYCRDCKWVFDHFTKHDFSDPEKSPFSQDRGIEGKGVPCPKCGKKETDFWNPGFPCPKCNTKMHEGGMVMRWD